MRARSSALIFGVLGVVISGGAIWHLIELDIGTETTFHVVLTAILTAGSGAGLLYGAYWHATRSLADERYPAILGWLVVSGGLFVVVSAVTLYAGSAVVTDVELLEAVHVAGSVGLGAGLFVGTLQARWLSSAKAAARAEAHATAVEAEQERLEHLHDLLRHYVLNGANIVTGYAQDLRETVPESDQHALDAIEGSANTMATLVRHVRSLPQVSVTTDEAGSTAMDAAIDSAVTQVESECTLTIEVTTAIPSRSVPETLGQSIYLLLDAMASVTDADGVVRISHDDERLAVEAEPASLSSHLEQSLFEPVGSDAGLDFYLAHALLGSEGTIELVDDDGTSLRFEIDLDA